MGRTKGFKEHIEKIFSNRNLQRLALLAVLLGVIIRLVFYFQNRGMYIDESNVARNIYKRGFKGLTAPLNYEQYAPPLFLWMVKCSTLLFGFSEYALRLFPLVCSIASLFVMNSILKEYTGEKARWYVLVLMATGSIYIAYAATLKQYDTDVLVVLSLLLLALRMDIVISSPLKFILTWCLAGSIAIWLSMPSVFMLAGVGTYYLYVCFKSKSYKAIFPIIIISGAWLLQFACYYFIILKPQITSDYLQNFHKDSFLTPSFSHSGMEHNIDVLNELLAVAGGKWTLSIVFHVITIVIGIGWLFKKYSAKLILLLVPVLCLLAAAFTKQYALTPRLVLFIMPMLLVLIATGLNVLLTFNSIFTRIPLIAVATICIVNFGSFNIFYKRWEMEEMPESLVLLQQQHIDAAYLYVDDVAAPSFIYYTTIHPAKDKWKDMAGAHMLRWDSNYDSLANTFTSKSAVLMGWHPDEDINAKRNTLKKYHKEVLQQQVMGSEVFIYE